MTESPTGEPGDALLRQALAALTGEADAAEVTERLRDALAHSSPALVRTSAAEHLAGLATKGPAAPGPRALACSYCGAALTVNLETVGPAYLTHDQVESIECDALDCQAVWEPAGEARDLPRWLRYPDLYTAPERAR